MPMYPVAMKTTGAVVIFHCKKVGIPSLTIATFAEKNINHGFFVIDHYHPWAGGQRDSGHTQRPSGGASSSAQAQLRDSSCGLIDSIICCSTRPPLSDDGSDSDARRATYKISFFKSRFL